MLRRLCDLETSRMGAPYIYDISTLRVNDLTFILLTWRKWLVPNNASRQQMGFNSGFKGLNVFSTIPLRQLRLCVLELHSAGTRNSVSQLTAPAEEFP